MTGFGSTALDELHDGAVVGHGVGVGHRADTGETALRGGTRTALDILFIFIAGLAQVNVHVH